MGRFIDGLLFLPLYMLVTEAIELYNRGLKISLLTVWLLPCLCGVRMTRDLDSERMHRFALSFDVSACLCFPKDNEITVLFYD